MRVMWLTLPYRHGSDVVDFAIQTYNSYMVDTAMQMTVIWLTLLCRQMTDKVDTAVQTDD